jgi:hypothetical protein
MQESISMIRGCYENVRFRANNAGCEVKEDTYQEKDINAGGTTWKYLFHTGQFRGFDGSSGPFQSVGSVGRFEVLVPFSRFPGLSIGLEASFSESLISPLVDIEGFED